MPAPGPGARGAGQPLLPGLERIIAALDAVAAERGYGSTDLAAVLERAGVGEAEFERHFVDLEDCFCAAVQAGTDELLTRAGAAFAADRPWRDQMRVVAYAMCDFLREDPARARVMVVESFSACDRSRQIRENGMAALAALIDLARTELDEPEAAPANTAELIAGAIYNRIHAAVEGGKPLTETMVRELMYTAVRPYYGVDAALAELDKARPAG
jgi:AcrR family transcriptional regulator